MIFEAHGDILSSSADALVNPVNCVGVMGRGLALEFKRRFPANFAVYAAACRAGEVRPGRVFVFRDGGRALLNFPTKRHWRDPSKLEDIRTGLADLAAVLERERIGSVAVPALGCGLGGLRWAEVRPLIAAALGGLATRVELYAPG